VTEPTSPDVWKRVVVPCALFAALDLVALVVALVTGHVVLAVFAAVLFVPFALLAVLGARFAWQTGRAEVDPEQKGHV
jgi:hypothetical protein